MQLLRYLWFVFKFSLLIEGNVSDNNGEHSLVKMGR